MTCFVTWFVIWFVPLSVPLFVTEFVTRFVTGFMTWFAMAANKLIFIIMIIIIYKQTLLVFKFNQVK